MLTESEPPESGIHHVTIFQTKVMYKLSARISKVGVQNVL